MNKIFRFLVLPLTMLAASCGGKEGQEKNEKPDLLSFSQSTAIVYEGEFIDVPVTYQKWDRGVYQKSDYDFEANPLGVNVSSSDQNVAIFENGKVKGIKAGSATLSLKCAANVRITGSLAVTVKKDSDPKPQYVKVLYWNIQNGMWSDQGNNYDKFVQFVKDLDPDICIWAEAKTHYKTDSDVSYSTSDNIYLPKNWDKLAARYGHSYTYVGGDRDWFPQAITSKYSIENVKRITTDGQLVISHGCGWAKIRVAGKDLNIVTVHTWPQKYGYNVSGSDAQDASAAKNEGDLYREKEIKSICSNTILTHKDAAQEYWLMAGDFNAESPADNFKLNYPLSDTRLLVHTHIRNNTPYVDIIEKMYPKQFQQTTRSGKRIDFVYLTQPLSDRVTAAEVIRDGFATSIKDTRYSFSHPSDHYPVFVTMDLK